MSTLGELASLLKAIMVREEINALKEQSKTSHSTALDHEKRLIRIETMIEMSRSPGAPTSRKNPKR